MSRFRLCSDRWDQPDPSSPGGYRRHRYGDVIDVPGDQVERLLGAGAIVALGEAVDRVAGPAPAPVAPVISEGHAPAVSVPDVNRPRQAAPKAAWVDYAVAQGMDRDEAEATDKRDLIAATN